MDQKRIQLIFIFIVFSNMASLQGKTITAQAGQRVEIDCTSGANTIIWLRIVDSGVEFLGTYTNGVQRVSPDTPEIYIFSKMPRTLIIKTFAPERDSGSYSCAELSGNKLKPEEVRRLRSAPVMSVTSAPAKPATQANTSPTLCTCNVKTDQAQSMWSCSPIIMGSIAGGYCVIILLLITTIIYCNRIRTRRCPHHYKRQKQRRKAGDEYATEN